MSKSDILLDNLFNLVDSTINTNDLIFCRLEISNKNKLLSDKELDNINSLLCLIIKDKEVMNTIKVNCILIYEDSKIDYNDIQYIIKLAMCLVELFNN